jgi:hypothetical protein
MLPLQTGADRVAKGAHVVRNSCFYDMAALAARPYDTVSLNLNGRAVRVKAKMRKEEYEIEIYANETQHCVLPRALGGRLVL